jgi:hypothetical protein
VHHGGERRRLFRASAERGNDAARPIGRSRVDLGADAVSQLSGPDPVGKFRPDGVGKLKNDAASCLRSSRSRNRIHRQLESFGGKLASREDACENDNGHADGEARSGFGFWK